MRLPLVFSPFLGVDECLKKIAGDDVTLLACLRRHFAIPILHVDGVYLFRRKAIGNVGGSDDGLQSGVAQCEFYLAATVERCEDCSR